jgi:hypothetical protein
VGWLDRLKKVGEGIGEVLTAPGEVVIELGKGAFTDEELDVFGTLKGEFAEALAVVSPDKGIGAALGAIPEGPRGVMAAPLNWVMDASEWAYREGLSEPVTTAMTAASLSDRDRSAGNLFGFGKLLFDKDTWREAYKIAQDRSPGQAIGLAVGTRDISDPKQVKKTEDSTWFKVASGTADAVLRLSPIDPLNAVAGTAVGLRRGLASVTSVEGAMNSTRVARFMERVDEIKATKGDRAAAVIRHELFPKHEQGGYIADLLASAGSRTEMNDTLRGLLGDQSALARLKTAREDIVHQIDNLVHDRADLFGLADPPPGTFDELNRLFRLEDQVDEGIISAGTIRELPRYTRAGELRSAISESRFYQKSPLTRPLRVVTNRVPHHWIDLNDGRSDIQLHRQLQKSRLPVEEQEVWRSRYMSAISPADRQRIATDAEAAITKATLSHYGVSQNDVDRILAVSRRDRDTAMGTLRNRRYDAEGRGVVEWVDSDGSAVRVHLPLHTTQKADLLPMADVDALERAAQAATGRGAIGKGRAFQAAHPVTDLPTETLELFYNVWRPATLLRAGWPMRVVLDEQLRIASELGVFSTMVDTIGKGGKELVDRAASAIARHTPLRRLDDDAFSIDAVNNRALARLDDPVVVGGVKFDSAFGAPGDQANLFAQRSSSAGTYRQLVSDERTRIAAEVRKHTGHFRTILPDEELSYPGAWEWAVNKQLRQADLPRQILDGKTVDEAVDWLSHADDGRAYAREMGWRPHTFRTHVEDVEDQVRRYIPDELWEKARSSDLGYDDLVRVRPDIATRPGVHGEDLTQALGRSTFRKMISDLSDKAFNALGKVPTDAASRHPYFARMYEQEITRLTGLVDDVTTLGPDDIARIQTQARLFSINETQGLLYDLAERSELAEIGRFFAPFFAATQEVAVTWIKQANRNPVFVNRMRQAYNAPERAGLVTDENGNIVLPNNGGAESPLTGEKVAAGGERYITLPFTVPGVPTGGKIAFNKRSINLVLTGGIGFGPPVQIAVNEAVKDRPDLADSVKFILPFGTTQEITTLLMPSTVRRASQLSAGEEDRVYANTLARMLYDRQVDFRLGRRDTEPTYEEVKRDTDALFMIRTAASWLLPFAPIFESPYKPYIDTYRQAQQRVRDDKDAVSGQSMLLADADGNPRSADEWFYDTFGEEFFPLTQSLSTSKDGVPPTLGGWKAREKYEDLIESYPELGGLIVGKEGAGEFARSVYDMQLATETRPGSGVMQRETPTFEEAQAKPGVAEGWLKYGRAMDTIDAVRIARGLPNLQVKAAEDLAAMKRTLTSKIASEFPEWFKEFSVVDRDAFNRKLEGMRAVVADDRLNKRPDLVGLAEYLRQRDLVLAVLASRETKSITASANQDIALLWETLKARLIEQNLAFSDTYYRFLSNDPMEVSK